MDACPAPDAILRFWRLVELLTPTTFPKRDARDRLEPVYDVFPADAMPWEPGHPHALEKCQPGHLRVATTRPNREWAYGVYAGLVDVARVRDDIESWLGDSEDHAVRDERPPQGTSVVGFQVNGDGRVIAETLVFSTFSWAYGLLRANSSHAAVKATAELTPERFADVEGEIMQRFDAELAGQRLDQSRLRRFLGWLVERLSLPEAILKGPCCRVQCVQRPMRRQQATEGDAAQGAEAPNEKLTAALEMLNSLFSDDLLRIEQAVSEGLGSTPLTAYLGQARPEQTDLRRDHDATWALLDPTLYPRGRWPGKGRFPLVFSQQVAVNQAFRQLQPEASGGAGLMAVNGPPGTGKTTLLKEIVAGIIVERARVLAEYTTPEDAFGRSTIAWENRQWTQHYAPLDPRLREFGIVVASSNNGAVENVTKEFPKADEVDPEWGQRASPFNTIASALLGDDEAAWCLTAACLGNSQNRNAFADGFWGWERKEEPGHTRVPALLKSARAGEGADGVLSWERAVEAFETALAHEEECRQARHRVYRRAGEAVGLQRQRDERYEKLTTCEREQSHLAARVDAAQRQLAEAQARYLAHKETISDERRRALDNANEREATLTRRQNLAREAQAEAEARLVAHEKRAPLGLLRWFSRHINPLKSVKRWTDEHAALTRDIASHTDLVRQAQQARLAVINEVARCQEALSDAALRAATGETGRVYQEAQLTWQTADAEYTRAREYVAQARHELGTIEADLAQAMSECEMYRQTHGGGHLLQPGDLEEAPADKEPRSPWTDPEWEAARVAVFRAALDLHDAFVVAAGRKMSNNLRGVIQIIRGKAPADLPEGVAETLWSSLFMMVPLISTTFASFHRQFQHLGRESLGWLLIDEAGQAAPQYAAGALWRSRRALVVGDPLQLTPVVTVPDQLQAALASFSGVSTGWMPSFSSAQALADQASAYGSWIGDTWVGAPLLVHRRCENPMFSISNAVAYENAMVHGTKPGESRLPDSGWIDVPAQDAEAHWIPAEGVAVGELLGRLGDHGVASSDIFLISPFRSVVRQLSKLASRHKGIQAGTIHTVQGKEAKVVILVLGGNPSNDGAKAWAAQSPNLVNVAVSRAKHRLYVVGDRERWNRHAYFDECVSWLVHYDAAEFATATAVWSRCSNDYSGERTED